MRARQTDSARLSNKDGCQAPHSAGAKDNGVVDQSIGCNKGEKRGVAAHWGAPLTMPAGQLWRSISPGWHGQIGGHCFPISVGQGSSILLVSA
ncbi:MAG: hypothetical protein DSY79_13905 [Chloroflexi bacterium]|nr:MAG: hypothetical protein DSY79_13905 [Chloroflexota bacterium]